MPVGLKTTWIPLVVLLAHLCAAAVSGESPKGWSEAGSAPKDYEMGVDYTVFHTGTASAYVKNRESEPHGFGTLLQSFSAEEYRGKRLRLSAFIKPQDIQDWAGLWMRVDGPTSQLAFDNMQNRPIKGTTDWKEYEIVLDVPPASQSIYFGILLSGKGRTWMDDLRFEIVNDAVPTTDALSNEPINLDFED